MNLLKEVEQIKAHLHNMPTLLGHMPLIDEPLTSEDWAEIHRSLLSFQHQIRLIVLNARKRRKGNE